MSRKRIRSGDRVIIETYGSAVIRLDPRYRQKNRSADLLVVTDRWLHRVMRGRCWNHRVCLWVSEYKAMTDKEDTR